MQADPGVLLELRNLALTRADGQPVLQDINLDVQARRSHGGRGRIRFGQVAAAAVIAGPGHARLQDQWQCPVPGRGTGWHG